MSQVFDFFIWMDRVPITGVMAFPQARARDAIAGQALRDGTQHGRITVWLWRTKGLKVACAMARKNGDAGERPVFTVHGAPPLRDDDKAQMVFDRERA